MASQWLKSVSTALPLSRSSDIYPLLKEHNAQQVPRLPCSGSLGVNMD